MIELATQPAARSQSTPQQFASPALPGPGRQTDWILAREIMEWTPAHGLEGPPHYTTNLEDAWRLVERIEALILKDPIPYMDLFKLNSFGEGEYVADFGRYWWSREKTPAYAICCAAREAMQSIRDRNTTR